MATFFTKIITYLLTLEARAVLRKYSPKIVAITGSVGKTATKDAMYFAISSARYVRKSENNCNSKLDIPLTILGCKNAQLYPFGWIENIFIGLCLIIFKRDYPEWLVLEVGIDKPGDIKTTADWISPDIVVITNFSKTPAHIEFFNSRMELVEEKAALVKAIKDDGILILNGDDANSRSMAGLVRRDVIYYGFAPDCFARGLSVEARYKKGRRATPEGVTVKVKVEGKILSIKILGALGRQQAYPLAAALSLIKIKSLGLSLPSVADSFMAYTAPRGRMTLLDGIKRTVVIDDTYDSSPASVHGALDALLYTNTVGRRIAVLGDMFGLGKYSFAAHKKVGKHAARSGAVLLTAGLRARNIAEGALTESMDEKNIFQFEDAVEAGKFLQNFISEGDLILISGSRFMRMERVVEEIMAHPEDKDRLLVCREMDFVSKR